MDTRLQTILLEQLNCRDCWEKEIVLENPYNPPRGWACGSNPEEVQIVVVGLNPGHPLPEEVKWFSNKQNKRLDENDLKFLVDFATNIYKSEQSTYGRSGVYHRKLREYIVEALVHCGVISRNQKNEWHKFVWLTDAFKCSTVNESGPKIPTEFKRSCVQKHLTKELEFFNPKVIIALGTLAYNELLKTRWAGKTVYFRHPENGGPTVDSPVFQNQLKELPLAINQQVQNNVIESEACKMPDIREHLARCSKATDPLFIRARSILTALPGVSEKINSTYVAYQINGRGFLVIYGKMNHIRIDTIYFPEDRLTGLGVQYKVKPEHEHKGFFHYEFKILPHQAELIEPIIKLAIQHC